mmetsp:Transcript_12611/g.29676  ORF Transcript_12611/g.29676 Transcript_12611/m.29676 type:complete len:249 (+) Transcript_12611:671-1417(+)
MGPHHQALQNAIREIPGLQFLRAPDSLVFHLQLVHDGHLPLRPRLPHPPPDPAQRLRQVHPRGGRPRGFGPGGGGLGVEAGARGRVPQARAPAPLRRPGGHRLAAHRHRGERRALRHLGRVPRRGVRGAGRARHHLHRRLRPELRRRRIRVGVVLQAVFQHPGREEQRVAVSHDGDRAPAAHRHRGGRRLPQLNRLVLRYVQLHARGRGDQNFRHLALRQLPPGGGGHARGAAPRRQERFPLPGQHHP